MFLKDMWQLDHYVMLPQSLKNEVILKDHSAHLSENLSTIYFEDICFKSQNDLWKQQCYDLSATTVPWQSSPIPCKV